MAAPSGTVWGGICSNGYGRIGIYVKLTTTNTTVKREVQVWFWSKYSVQDPSNTLYYDSGASVTSASTSKGASDIATYVDTGSGWSTSNQQKLRTYTYEYTRGTSASTYKIYAKLTGVYNCGTMSANTSFTIPALASYTVKYDANGGSGAPSSQTKYYGKTLTLSSTKPTRTGYTFLGWSTSSSATSATYSAGGSYTTNASDTLYAVWKANTLTIKYNANGGSIDSDKYYLSSNVVYKISDSSALKQTGTYNNVLSSDGLYNNTTLGISRTGYNFKGWKVGSSGTTVFDHNDATIKPTDLTSNIKTGSCTITLYAVWELKTYTVSYNANGGSGAPSSQTKKYGQTLTLSSTKPTKSGYTFMGWGTSASDTSADYSAGGSYTANAGDTLYAVWKKTITLSYNANGGSGAPSSSSADIYNSTTSKTFTISSTKPTRTGYTFLGWSTSSSATSATYSAGDSITLSANDTLYAVWKANTYTVSYNANGGSGAPSSQSYIYHSTESITLSSTKPTRTGYTFLGWSASSDATSATYTAGGEYRRWNISRTIYAVWKANTYTVSYNANGGSGAPSEHSYTYAPSGTITLSSTKPTRDGYTFKNWNTKADGSGTSYSSGGTFNRYNASTTLYAQWTINTYTLTVNPNGGTWNGTTANSSVTQNYNTTKSIPNPTWTGHTFSGWSKSGSGTLSGTTFTFGAGNATLKAVWDTNIYTLTLNPNGGKLDDSTSAQKMSDEYGTVIALPTPTRTGYTFVGWGTTSTDTTADYNPNSNLTLTKDTTLYAIWKIASYELTVKPNGGTWSDSASAQTFTQNYKTTKTIANPTRTGYTFVGWTHSGSGSLSGTTFTFGAGDSTLTAKWEINTYAVTFDAGTNGGMLSDSNLATDSLSIDYGNKIIPFPVAVRKNYVFLGWFTSASGGTKITSSYVVKKNVTLYAQFEIDASAYVNEDSVWEEGVTYVTDKNGNVKKGHAKVNVNGVWKDGYCK